MEAYPKRRNQSDIVTFMIPALFGVTDVTLFTMWMFG